MKSNTAIRIISLFIILSVVLCACGLNGNETTAKSEETSSLLPETESESNSVSTTVTETESESQSEEIETMPPVSDSEIQE